MSLRMTTSKDGELRANVHVTFRTGFPELAVAAVSVVETEASPESEEEVRVLVAALSRGTIEAELRDRYYQDGAGWTNFYNERTNLQAMGLYEVAEAVALERVKELYG